MIGPLLLATVTFGLLVGLLLWILPGREGDLPWDDDNSGDGGIGPRPAPKRPEPSPSGVLRVRIELPPVDAVSKTVLEDEDAGVCGTPTGVGLARTA